MPRGDKPAEQAKQEADARATRPPLTGPEFSAGITGCLRLHAPHQVQEDGSPEFTHEFLTKLNASANAKRRRAAEAEEHAALEGPRNYVTVPELAELMEVNPTTIRRACRDKEIDCTRRGPYGWRHIAWPVAKAYLATSGYTPEAIAAMEALWARRMEAY